MSQAAYSTPHRLPATLGSSARRRGAEADRQRAPTTNATASAATLKSSSRTLSSALATPASGHTSSTLSGLVEEQQHRELQDEQTDEERPDEDAVDGRHQPAAGHEAQDQRGERDDPQLADQRREREGRRRPRAAPGSGRSRTPNPAAVRRRPTALSGRRRQAMRPHAANDTPESVWMVS